MNRLFTFHDYLCPLRTDYIFSFSDGIWDSSTIPRQVVTQPYHIPKQNNVILTSDFGDTPISNRKLNNRVMVAYS